MSYLFSRLIYAFGAGYLVAKGAITLTLAFTPVGWVAITGTAAVAVGATVGAASAVNHFAEKNSSSWYNNYLELLRN